MAAQTPATVNAGDSPAREKLPRRWAAFAGADSAASRGTSSRGLARAAPVPVDEDRSLVAEAQVVAADVEMAAGWSGTSRQPRRPRRAGAEHGRATRRRACGRKGTELDPGTRVASGPRGREDHARRLGGRRLGARGGPASATSTASMRGVVPRRHPVGVAQILEREQGARAVVVAALEARHEGRGERRIDLALASQPRRQVRRPRTT